MKCFFLILLILIIEQLNAQRKHYSKEDYIDKYKVIAVSEMKRSGIPASIILAQGMLESEDGNSSLARISNNHFGIKCHKTWEGEKVYHDDDKENECFRKYNSPEDSYRDHTDFLVNTKRYAFLFDYHSDDYKKWAKGLKKAGYATSRSYEKELIRIIEENELYRLDQGDFTRMIKNNKKSDSKNEDFVIDIRRRKVLERNRIKYILAIQGDNLEKITREMDLFSWQLSKYNELPKDAKITPGQVLYIQPKRCRAEAGKDFHIVQNGEKMYDISQLYGMKLKRLYRKNRMQPGQEPQEGQKLWLRKRKPAKES